MMNYDFNAFVGAYRTHTNPPGGVTITNSWDVLFRLTKVSSPLGSVVNTYTNLDLIGTTDPLGNTNGFLYNNMGQKTQATDARGYSQTYDY